MNRTRGQVSAVFMSVVDSPLTRVVVFIVERSSGRLLIEGYVCGLITNYTVTLFKHWIKCSTYVKDWGGGLYRSECVCLRVFCIMS